MHILDQSVHLLTYFGNVSGERKLDAGKAVDGNFRGRQHHLACRVTGFIAGLTPCFRKAEMMKEPGEASAANAPVAQLERAPTIVGKVDAVDHADVLAQLELAATLERLLLIGLDEFSHRFGLRQQNRRDYSLARAPADRLLADRKSLEQLRMGLLVRLRYHIDLLDASQLIDLAIRPIFAGP